jgi:hypothetical protein
MAGNDKHRDACKRAHKFLGLYLVLSAWAEKVDCVIVERKELLSYLQIERMKTIRIKWLKEDL